jgi:hypothetical protein
MVPESRLAVGWGNVPVQSLKMSRKTDTLCGRTLVVFLSIEEVSIPKLGEIFRVPKVFEVSNSLVYQIEFFF